ncbi:VOC family protein [uncultured Parabacteroides sp.]|uniref:VOC family protein n=1 Tax=uncultured Parabacteroides sp. TaxID=512312 RepID=UPI00342746D7
MNRYRIHHIAVATDDIEKTAELYRQMGYTVSGTVEDLNQHVYVAFCEHRGVELN